ncbi:hypothetical protein Ahy_A02g004982 isoform B [Arachis hypogaea]|uniref:Small ribosomal subunit protein mS41 SAM domain-containing protein n=1 Tax=Arachis hypogaea TaxID=3818 RepID=A0A445E5D2_ARAHY|nr:hypothetical protein Ahy_A02g004982 isoform B [Arachis hypogaea]
MDYVFCFESFPDEEEPPVASTSASSKLSLLMLLLFEQGGYRRKACYEVWENREMNWRTNQSIFAHSTMATWLQRIIRTRASSFPPTTPKLLPHHSSSSSSSRFFSKSTQYIVKVGIPEFLTGIGNGVESHVAKLESELGDFQKLLVTRTLKLKKLGIPCKHLKIKAVFVSFIFEGNGTEEGRGVLKVVVRCLVNGLKEGRDEMKEKMDECDVAAAAVMVLWWWTRKLILKYAHKYRLGLWRPRAEPMKA